jgi:hypothetical protein
MNCSKWCLSKIFGQSLYLKINSVFLVDLHRLVISILESHEQTDNIILEGTFQFRWNAYIIMFYIFILGCKTNLDLNKDFLKSSNCRNSLKICLADWNDSCFYKLDHAIFIFYYFCYFYSNFNQTELDH